MLQKIAGIALAVACLSTAAVPAARADVDLSKLPEGPIRDRVQLMEEIGAAAKKINDSLKAGDTAAVIAPAEEIAKLTPKFPTLFPEGSTDPNSRAKPNIWTNPDEFDAYNEYLAKYATAIATAARDGGNVKSATKKMFKSCKSCHKKYRVPDED